MGTTKRYERCERQLHLMQAVQSVLVVQRVSVVQLVQVVRLVQTGDGAAGFGSADSAPGSGSAADVDSAAGE